MAYLRIASANTFFVALLSVLCDGITGTVGSYAEQAAYDLADVALADMSQFQLDIGSTDLEWYSEGMRIYAYEFLDFYWEKTDLTWALLNSPTVMTPESVRRAIGEACAKWAAESRFKFTEATSAPADIRIKFIPVGTGYDSDTKDPKEPKMDNCGVDIEFSDSEIWVDRYESRFCSFRFRLLYEIGHALGLNDSDDPESVMYKFINLLRVKSLKDPALSQDDKDGIKARYNKDNKDK